VERAVLGRALREIFLKGKGKSLRERLGKASSCSVVEPWEAMLVLLLVLMPLLLVLIQPSLLLALMQAPRILVPMQPPLLQL